MRLVGLTGGIGSGKSSVSARMSDLGAIIIDADAIVRELQEPGQPVFVAMVERWGEGIVHPSGALDRARVAGIVFNDEDQLRELEGIVHPALGSEIRSRIGTHEQTDRVVILDMALLAERGRNAYDVEAIVVVDCPVEETIRRLVRHRGFTEDDARARIANQATRDARLALADYVIDNGGSEADLDGAVRECHRWIVESVGQPLASDL